MGGWSGRKTDGSTRAVLILKHDKLARLVAILTTGLL